MHTRSRRHCFTPIQPTAVFHIPTSPWIPCASSPWEVAANPRTNCHFRIRAGRRAKYITVKGGVLDAEALDDMPLDFETILPPLEFSSASWKSASTTRNPATHELEAPLSSADQPGVKTIWAPRLTDCFDIVRTEFLNLLTQ